MEGYGVPDFDFGRFSPLPLTLPQTHDAPPTLALSHGSTPSSEYVVSESGAGKVGDEAVNAGDGFINIVYNPDHVSNDSDLPTKLDRYSVDSALETGGVPITPISSSSEERYAVSDAGEGLRESVSQSPVIQAKGTSAHGNHERRVDSMVITQSSEFSGAEAEHTPQEPCIDIPAPITPLIRDAASILSTVTDEMYNSSIDLKPNEVTNLDTESNRQLQTPLVSSSHPVKRSSMLMHNLTVSSTDVKEGKEEMILEDVKSNVLGDSSDPHNSQDPPSVTNERNFSDSSKDTVWSGRRAVIEERTSRPPCSPPFDTTVDLPERSAEQAKLSPQPPHYANSIALPPQQPSIPNMLPESQVQLDSARSTARLQTHSSLTTPKPLPFLPNDESISPRTTSAKMSKPLPHPSSPAPPAIIYSTADETSQISSKKQETTATRQPSGVYRSRATSASRSPTPLPASQPQSSQLALPEQRTRRRSSSTSRKIDTAGVSRTNSRSIGHHTIKNNPNVKCNFCETIGPDRSFCNACEEMCCKQCWDQQPQHRRAYNAASLPHERTDRGVADKIRQVLTPDLTVEARDTLHELDMFTTWFGVVREENELPLFREYGRYAELITQVKAWRDSLERSPSEQQNDSMHPSLVSFVGQTGDGKSTLIKLLVDLKSEEGDDVQTPVVGAPDRHVATSEDVHLYLDPESCFDITSNSPILYADCEGLEGGERVPVGARLRKKLEKSTLKDGPQEDGLAAPRLKHISQRELLWARSAMTQSREYAVANLYPRLLYTFSDVVVFVLKNSRTIEGVLKHLLDWAKAALETSSNQPVLPHAIIALNASNNNIDERLWDVEHATSRLMESLPHHVLREPKFKDHVDFWEDREREVKSVKQLLLRYYTSISVVHIPTSGRPNLIQQQVKRLSDEIRRASTAAQARKEDIRMLLDANEFAPYLQFAFDHFARNLDQPFDFVQASFIYSPIPLDFGGNILKLAIQVMNSWKDLARGPTIFEELSYLVASCIMLDAARNKIRGTPDKIFPMYLVHIDNALEDFCYHHWPCEFIGPKLGRCVNVRSGHGAKGHQLKSGRLLSAGQYVSKFSFEAYRPEFQRDIYHKLTLLTDKLKARVKEGVSEELVAADIHRQQILSNFLRHTSRGAPKAFASHTVCFSCLFEPPEHALPCGHIICTKCLRTYGKEVLNAIEIQECPVEKMEQRFRNVWTVPLKPESCGIRVLTLDGGGVRGLVELKVLQAIGRQFGDRIHIQSFFDLIVGTSTGGIIALGLTARNWTLQECLENFEKFCDKAFTARKGTGIPGMKWIVENYYHSRYKTGALDDALQTAFSKTQYLFGGQREIQDQGSLDVKVAVTATSVAGKGVVLANYNRIGDEKLSYYFQRPEKLEAELKTWEAARATSAAPKYFRAFCHEPSKQVYSDGGIYNNNPVGIADSERKLIWPDRSEEEVDILVSIGSGRSQLAKAKGPPRFTKPRGIINHGKYLSKLASNRVHAALDSESAWNDYLKVRAPSRESLQRYVRINPMLKNVPKLDDGSQNERMKQETEDWLRAHFNTKELAKRLVATCFYFETVGDVKELQGRGTEVYEVSGNFRCRFTKSELQALGDFIQRNATNNDGAYFAIKKEGDPIEQEKKIRLNTKIVDRMSLEGLFRMDKSIEIRCASRAAKTEISLRFARDAAFPISGFPRRLHADRSTMIGSRNNLHTTTSTRWASRTRSQEQRVKEWKPPDSMDDLGPNDTIERYSNPTHLLGRAVRIVSMAELPPGPPNGASELESIDTERLDGGHSEDSSDPPAYCYPPDRSQKLVHNPMQMAGESQLREYDAEPTIRNLWLPEPSTDPFNDIKYEKAKLMPIYELSSTSIAASELMSAPIHELSGPSKIKDAADETLPELSGSIPPGSD